MTERKDLSTIISALEGDRGDEQRLIAERIVKWGSLLLRKNSDYGGSVFKEPVLAPGLPPRTAIRVRMSDKIERLRNLLKRRRSNGAGPEVDESFEDTMEDLGAYALLFLVCPAVKPEQAMSRIALYEDLARQE